MCEVTSRWWRIGFANQEARALSPRQSLSPPLPCKLCCLKASQPCHFQLHTSCLSASTKGRQ